MTKLAMMVKMLLEMLYQKSASEVVPVSLLALKPSVKGTIAAINVSRTRVTSKRGSEGEDWVAKSVGVDDQQDSVDDALPGWQHLNQRLLQQCRRCWPQS